MNFLTASKSGHLMYVTHSTKLSNFHDYCYSPSLVSSFAQETSRVIYWGSEKSRVAIIVLGHTSVVIHSQTLLKRYHLLSFQTFSAYSCDVCSTHNVDLRERHQYTYLLVGGALTSFHIAV
jgi:hypothetical protein